MGLFDKLFGKKKENPKEMSYAMSLNGWSPIFGQYGTNIYDHNVVQQVIACIVNELKKLNPTHIRMNGSDPVPVKGNIQNILNNPNPLMTSSEFLEKIGWLLLLNYNAFIIPTYYTWTDTEWDDEQNKYITVERRRYEALYPIKPTQVDFIEDTSGTLYVNFHFANGKTSLVSYKDVIHIKYNYSVNEYMGGNEAGQPDRKALLEYLDINDTLIEGVAKAMKASYAVNAIIKYNTMIDKNKAEENLRDMEEKLANNESGFLGIDLKNEFIPLNRNVAMVDDNTLKWMDSVILRTWRVPLSILTGDYTPQQYEAFYQSCLEPLIISISQAFTKRMFTQRQLSYGNEIKLYPKELIFMTVDQTIEMIKELSPTGALFENEKRAALGLRPLPELEGQRYISLNWIEADKSAEYQLGRETNEGEEDNG